MTARPFSPETLADGYIVGLIRIIAPTGPPPRSP